MSVQEPWERPPEQRGEPIWPRRSHWQHPDWRHWRPGSGPPPWAPTPQRPGTPDDLRQKRRFIYWRFGGFLLLLMLLVAGGIIVISFHANQSFGGSVVARLIWLMGCGLALAFPMMAVGMAMRAFRRFAVPLADIMTAADAVAGGDLGVRVPVRGTREFQQLAESFNRMTEELETTDLQRRNLTADVAHELRTPLHIIQGNLEGILDGVYEPTKEHVEATLEETRQLARLVDDLRTLSLAETGQLPLVREPVNVADLLADVITSFSGQAEDGGVTLRTNCPPEKAALQPVGERSNVNALTVLGDAGRLDQVLSNLVVNAIRHTPPGGLITLSAIEVAQRVQITVRDTGKGIAAEELPFIFDRFWKGDRARTHVGGAGSGLGLSIARQLIQAHGGEITVESQPGQGTTFLIDLPRAS